MNYIKVNYLKYKTLYNEFLNDCVLMLHALSGFIHFISIIINTQLYLV